MSNERREDHPHDRLTRLADEGVRAIREHPEFEEGDKVIVLIDTDSLGGMCIDGYEGDDSAILQSLFGHSRALLRTNGADLAVAKLGQR